MNNCIFCKIVRDELTANVVYRDDSVIAFKDINPQAPIHILICPQKHIPTILDISDKDELMKIFIVANKLASEYNCDESGFRIVVNCKEDAGQAVPHLHFHLLGGRRFNWPPG